ncbi:ABC transporter permease [Paenibacillus pasadenensis]|uniref:ABC transporter permease n=1 Tax=Paenibacillus pasadenensis TaxID=217090 RepID=UPI00203E4884|nr:ABC transporter permease [Paenibacillus pasadenensis]MCM3748570.1 ABC transporter permease [Paenibacillus pasadenensis]
MSDFWTVTGFTFRNKVKGKAFVVTTIILVLILSLVINLPYIISLFKGEGGNDVEKVGYVSVQSDMLKSSVTPTLIGGWLKEYYESQPEESRSLTMVPIEGSGDAAADESLLKKAIADGKVDGYVELTPNKATGFYDAVYKSEKMMEGSIATELRSGLQIVKTNAAGLTDAQKKLLYAPVEVSSMQINAGTGEESGRTAAQQGVNIGLVYAVLFLLFMSIMATGQVIASEVTTEKSSRIMEVLITSVSPLNSMFGKIMGMFFVGILQIAIYVATVVINVNIPTNKDALGNMNIHLNDASPDLLIVGLLFYLTGYFLYATLYAAVGSLVSRTEDLGQAVMPLTFLSLGGFYIGMFSLSVPDSMLVKVTSFIPFFSPYTMVLRSGVGSVEYWEIGLSLVIMLVSIYVFGWLSAKIYRTGVLLYGKRPSIKELRKAMKAYKI